MRDAQKVSDLLGIIQAKQVGESEHHDDLEGDGVALAKLAPKEREKPGKFLLPHGIPSDDRERRIFIEGHPCGLKNQRPQKTTELSVS